MLAGVAVFALCFIDSASARTLAGAHATGTIHNAKDAIIVANGVLPPVLVTVPGEDKHSSLHSRILGQKPHQQVTVKVRKVPRKMFGVPHKVHSPTPDELHHLQEVQELDNVFHHVEDEHHKAQEEHHRDPIKTHYSVDSSGRINHVTVEEMMAYKDAHNSHVSHEQIMKEKEALSAKLAREERQHARLHTASEKLVSELLYEDHLPQAEPEKNASSKDGVDLEKDDWLQDKQEKQGHKWPILLVLVAIAILAAVALAILIPVPTILRQKKTLFNLKRKSSVAPQPWDIYDSYCEGPMRSPRRRPVRGNRDLSSNNFYSGFEQML